MNKTKLKFQLLPLYPIHTIQKNYEKIANLPLNHTLTHGKI